MCGPNELLEITVESESEVAIKLDSEVIIFDYSSNIVWLAI
jgi:hypothetical protein